MLTGDYRYKACGPSHDVYPHMEKILAAINARYGIVGVLGNHDSLEKVPVLERLGVTMLMNQSLPVSHGGDTIWLVGLDDPHYYGCDDLPGASMASLRRCLKSCWCTRQSWWQKRRRMA